MSLLIIGGLIMSITLFSIVFPIMILGMLVLLFMNVQTLTVVKAGKVTKLCKEKSIVFGSTPSEININGVRIDVSKDTKMLVNGNSMKNYNIFDGQRIYVKPMTDEEKQEIRHYPVLVFNIVDGMKGDAKYKLRKFVGYVRDNDFKTLHETLHERIKVPVGTFTSQCAPKYNKLRERYSETLVLSETYDEDNDTLLYSLHPVSTIFGKVEYAM